MDFLSFLNTSALYLHRCEGNERLDRLVQWGKTAGPFSRFTAGGGSEGDGRYGALVGIGRIRSAKRPLIPPNGYIGEEIAKELMLDEEHSTTESESKGSKESERSSGEENGLGSYKGIVYHIRSP